MQTPAVVEEAAGGLDAGGVRQPGTAVLDSDVSLRDLMVGSEGRYEGALSAGEHQFEFTSVGWSSCVYVVRVAGEGITQARAFVIAR